MRSRRGVESQEEISEGTGVLMESWNLCPSVWEVVQGLPAYRQGMTLCSWKSLPLLGLGRGLIMSSRLSSCVLAPQT